MTGQTLGAVSAVGKRARVNLTTSGLSLVANVTHTIPFDNKRFDTDAIFDTNGTALTGTVAKTTGGTTLTGTGTHFTTELAAGDPIQVGTELNLIRSIASDMSLTVSYNWGSTASGVSATRAATRLTCHTAGLYVCRFRVYTTAGSTSGDRDIRIRLNGSTLIDFERLTAQRIDTQLLALSEWELAAGDYVEGQVTSTVDCSLSISAGVAPEFGIVGAG